MKKNNIVVSEHEGTWYIIDSMVVNSTNYHLLEHEEYGDETASIIIDDNGTLVLDDVWNGFSDLRYHFK